VSSASSLVIRKQLILYTYLRNHTRGLTVDRRLPITLIDTPLQDCLCIAIDIICTSYAVTSAFGRRMETFYQRLTVEPVARGRRYVVYRLPKFADNPCKLLVVFRDADIFRQPVTLAQRCSAGTVDTADIGVVAPCQVEVQGAPEGVELFDAASSIEVG
jgi:hypothetical protein